ncbi:MarC family protein [Ruegeria sp.]|uniref:MarC family protein n=1 Tax=Ruegeria sp. TaxID=1879320 RepID=UPI0023115614|nr:MarC family protein [Ruegeria sp.]MDA7964842.1 MarC family protein [Ruegeria sp.]
MGELFDQAVFLKFLAAVLAIFNPLYNIPIFLSMTRDCTTAERRRVALIVTASVTVIALIAVMIGEEVLAIFGIDVPSFRIAGGIIIFGIGMSMLKAEDRAPGDQAALAEGHARKLKFAVVPLAIPLTIGPGTIAITIVFSHQLSDGAEIVTLGSAVLIACAIVGVGLLFADQISRLLGETMINVLTRIMAILLVAVAVEMVLTGTFNAIDKHYPRLSSMLGG